MQEWNSKAWSFATLLWPILKRLLHPVSQRKVVIADASRTRGLSLIKKWAVQSSRAAEVFLFQNMSSIVVCAEATPHVCNPLWHVLFAATPKPGELEARSFWSTWVWNACRLTLGARTKGFTWAACSVHANQRLLTLRLADKPKTFDQGAELGDNTAASQAKVVL